MTTDINEIATEKIRKAMWQVRSHRELIGLGPMLDRMQTLAPMPSHPTMAVDGERLIFNPEFVNGLLQSTLRAVIVHEAMHIGHSHHLRIKRGEFHPYVANQAMDHVINNEIIRMQAFRSGFLGTQGIDEFWCCDPKYADSSKWSWERVYSDIYAKESEEEEPEGPGEDGDGDGDDEGEGTGQGQQDDDGDTEGDGDGDTEGDDEGDGEDPDTGGGGQLDPDPDEEKDSPVQGGGAPAPAPPAPPAPPQSPSRTGGRKTLGEVLPAPNPTEDEDQQEHNEIQEDLARGEFMEKCIGQGSGGNRIMGTIRDASKDDPGEWGYLKELLAQEFSEDRTWARPNLYHMQDHGVLPGRDKDSGELVVWVDMSGSMSNNELEACYSNLVAICEDVGIKRVHLGYFDGAVLQTEQMKQDETVFQVFEVGAGDTPEFTVMGRGGTHVDPCFRATDDEAIDVQCMVIFTDGELVCRVDDPGYPVIWATTNEPPRFGSYYESEDHRAFGEVVHIEARSWWGSRY